MKKVIIYWFCFLGILLWMTSCQSAKPVIIEKTITETETITVRDTIIETQADTAVYQALLACQNGKVVIKEGGQVIKPSKTISGQIKLDDKGQLTINCIKEVEQLKAQLKDKVKTTIIKEEVPVFVPAEITSWQWFQIWSGRIFLMLLLGLLIGFLSKKIKF